MRARALAIKIVAKEDTMEKAEGERAEGETNYELEKAKLAARERAEGVDEETERRMRKRALGIKIVVKEDKVESVGVEYQNH